MSQAAYARHARVHPSTVNRWIQNGRISIRPDGLIDPTQADRERSASESPMPHHQARKAQLDAEKQAAEHAKRAQQVAGNQDAEPVPGIERLGAALKLETYKLQKAKAEAANMELDKISGALVDRDDVDRVLADFGATLRNMLENMPYRVAPALCRHRGDVNAVQAELESLAADLLEEISTHMARKMEASL